MSTSGSRGPRGPGDADDADTNADVILIEPVDSLAPTPAVAARARVQQAVAGPDPDPDPDPESGTGTGTGTGTAYVLGELLGRGGMGEVILARDQTIGRDVAIKRMRSTEPDPETTARFLREARIQARLEHPAIVPVHELGTDADGQPYFTMKRLAGVTLHQLIADRAPAQRLLRAFVDVCLAVEFAHARGIVHRDLKPQNIMLGDFGEVYVLDWGIARVLADAASSMTGGDIVTLDGQTQVGAVIGTPGFMSPEQVEGDPVGTASDVYALGAILFEILTGEGLHPRTTAALAITLARPCVPPSERKPGGAIAPELDAACTAALAADPADRPSARALAERVQRYLDGDRDLERRRVLAEDHLVLARAALASGDPARRAEAVRAAGRALALDPTATEAADLVTSFLVEPPRELPAELVASLADAERQASRVRSKKAMVAFILPCTFVVLVPLVDVRSWPLLIAFFAVMLGLAAMAWASYRRGQVIVPLALASTLVGCVVFSRVAGPFILTPVFTAAVLIGVSAIPWMTARRPAIIGFAIVASSLPVALEVVGLFDRTWWSAGDVLVTRSAMLAVHGWVEPVALVAANTFFTTILGLFALAITRDRTSAQRELHIQAWHLRQLIPR
jgi:serine/threonine protein kinase